MIPTIIDAWKEERKIPIFNRPYILGSYMYIMYKMISFNKIIYKRMVGTILIIRKIQENLISYVHRITGVKEMEKNILSYSRF